jgi:hypothetical protein
MCWENRWAVEVDLGVGMTSDSDDLEKALASHGELFYAARGSESPASDGVRARRMFNSNKQPR